MLQNDKLGRIHTALAHSQQNPHALLFHRSLVQHRALEADIGRHRPRPGRHLNRRQKIGRLVDEIARAAHRAADRLTPSYAARNVLQFGRAVLHYRATRQSRVVLLTSIAFGPVAGQNRAQRHLLRGRGRVVTGNTGAVNDRRHRPDALQLGRSLRRHRRRSPDLA